MAKTIERVQYEGGVEVTWFRVNGGKLRVSALHPDGTDVAAVWLRPEPEDTAAMLEAVMAKQNALFAPTPTS